MCSGVNCGWHRHVSLSTKLHIHQLSHQPPGICPLCCTFAVLTLCLPCCIVVQLRSRRATTEAGRLPVTSPSSSVMIPLGHSGLTCQRLRRQRKSSHLHTRRGWRRRSVRQTEPLLAAKPIPITATPAVPQRWRRWAHLQAARWRRSTRLYWGPMGTMLAPQAQAQVGQGLVCSSCSRGRSSCTLQARTSSSSSSSSSSSRGRLNDGANFHHRLTVRRAIHFINT
jgi:hypothetical protein